MHRWGQDCALRATKDCGSSDPGTVERLRAFHARAQLKKFALGVVMQCPPSQVIHDLRAAFLRLDCKNQGTLCINDIEQAIMQSCCTHEAQLEMRQLLYRLDDETATVENIQREVDYQKFLLGTLDRKQTLQEEACRHAFNTFDLNLNGYLTKDELREVFRGTVSVGPDVEVRLRDVIGMDCTEIDRIVQEMDKDGDDAISFQEFLEKMTGDVTKMRRMSLVDRLQEATGGFTNH